MRFTVQKTGLCFAMFAWLVQFSVFLTPLFTDHPELGFGVCYQLEHVIAASQHDMMTMTDMSGTSMTQHDMSLLPSTSQKKHHPATHQDAQCQICSLMSHLASVNLEPVSISFILLAAEHIQVKFLHLSQRLLTFERNILPPSQAPPSA